MTPKILVVEDDRDFLQFLQIVLEGAGFLANLASSAPAARRWLDEPGAKPDLILLDIGLSDPTMDGLDFCLALKRSAATHRIPVIILTGQAQNAARIRAAVSQADMILHKPIEPDDLLKAIRLMLAAPKERRKGLLHRAGLEIDPVKKTVFFHGRTIPDLGDRLFEVLYLLVEHAPNPVSGRQILAALNLQVRDSEAYVLVSRLRARLRKELGVELVATVPRRGYRFEAPVAQSSQT